MGCDLVFEGDAFRRGAFDEDANQAGFGGFGDETIDLDARKAEPLRDLFLGIAADERKPCGTSREATIVAQPRQRFLPDFFCLNLCSGRVHLFNSMPDGGFCQASQKASGPVFADRARLQSREK
jgi:hypothetical protein